VNIDPSTTVAGIPILKVRGFLKRWRNDAWTPRWIARELAIRQDQAVAVLEELEAHGFLERKSEREWRDGHVAVQGSATPLDERDPSESHAWSTTLKGNALAMASAARPVLRKTAERVLAEFLERVKEVRESDTFLYRVKRVIMFGSMLDADRSRVNDIDLVVELVHKVKNRETAFRMDQDYAASRQREGRSFNTHVDYMFPARTDTLKFLRKRSRLLSFHRTEDEVWRDARHRVIYEDLS
jgi:predicted nucleotidyltransferase